MSIVQLMKLFSDPEAQESLADTVDYYRAAFDLLIEREGITQAEIQERIEKRKVVENGREN